MFLLRDIPPRYTLDKLAQRYSELDPSALMCLIMLLRTGSDLSVIFDKILSRYGLSQGRFLTLIVLNRNPNEEITPSELSDKVGVTRATMTGLLTNLSKDGLVDLVQHKEDRRKFIVQLTSTGRKILDEILPGYYREISILVADLKEDEREQFINFLVRIGTAVQNFKR
ncbi:MAG: MarR family transcriptional regulator [Desulfobacteraceae bacterium]|nr:MAG: MarR family transcriptional regulator [Desulfobacteraceae bacterium]